MAVYPTITAGQEITADLLISMLPVMIWKTSSTTRNNTVTLTDDPDLQYTLAANATYHIEMFLHYNTPAAANLRTDWNYTGTGSGNKCGLGLGTSVTETTPQGIMRSGIHGITTDLDYGERAGTNDCFAYEASLFTTTTTGLLSFRWAQTTATVGDTVLSANSRMRIQRFA
jgi:hypothetical protein